MNQKEFKILKAIKESKYWKPELTKIAKDLKIPLSTVFDVLKRNKYRILMKVKYAPSKEELELAEEYEDFTGLACEGDNK